MKNKINRSFIILAAFAICFTAIFTVFVYYQVFQKEVFEDLKSFSNVLEETGIFETENINRMEQYAKSSSNIRITVVNEDGTVKYDTASDVNKMENHKDRPEIASAFKNGEGRAIRTSATINKSTYYYALLLGNGSVLRVAKESRSIVSIFFSMLPVLLGIMLVLFMVCLLMSHYLTKSLIKPIENMAANLDHLENVETYKELLPFVDLIREQHDDILSSARMRQEFTANVSHELKTPLTSISGYSELIENGMAKEDDVKRFASEIHQNAGRLISLINDIIQLSELDSSTDGNLNIMDIDLLEIASNSVEMLKPVAEKKEISISLEGGKTVVRADKDMMDEVIYNLIDNAIRYNNQGGHIWVTLSPEDSSITVKDDGIGISEENQKRIFERFFRVDKSRSKKTGGTGLGLAIVKHIVELHNATIALESAEGKGTSITVKF